MSSFMAEHVSRSNKHPLYQLLACYWVSVDKWKGTSLAGSVLCLGFMETLLYVWYNDWYGNFYNSLQQGQSDKFWAAVPMLILLLAAPLFSGTIKGFLDSWLQLRWRRGMTDYMLKRWLSHKAFYRIERDNRSDNPDQRITEDVAQFIQLTMTLTIRLLTTFVSLASFSYLTWSKGGALNINLLGIDWNIPGYMFWLALIYAILDSLVTHIAGWRLLSLNIHREAVEAELRYALVQTRDNSEQIALYNGEETERKQLLSRFGAIWRISKRMFLVNAQVDIATGFTSRLSALLPLIVLAPSLLEGRIDLGTMMSTTAAWASTANGFAWFANNYMSIIQWRAAARRLELLNKVIDELPTEPIIIVNISANNLLIDELVLKTPRGEVLAEVGSFSISPGERWMISGPSGVGKSTFLRTMAGLWVYGTGKISIPADVTRLFLPQRSYIPSGSLKAALCYPSAESAFSDEQCLEAMKLSKLQAFSGRLHTEARWTNQLSIGEQQRVAFARVFLQQPGLLFLDEATSALDTTTEQYLYRMVLESLPKITLVSVAHRESLAELHTHLLVLKAPQALTWPISPNKTRDPELKTTSFVAKNVPDTFPGT